MDENVKSSHSEDVERGEFFVNERVFLSDEAKP